jgi:hypothetical protein
MRSRKRFEQDHPLCLGERKRSKGEMNDGLFLAKRSLKNGRVRRGLLQASLLFEPSQNDNVESKEKIQGKE